MILNVFLCVFSHILMKNLVSLLHFQRRPCLFSGRVLLSDS